MLPQNGFYEILILIICRNLSREIFSHENLTGITFNLHEYQNKFTTISRAFLLRMANVSDRFVEKIKTHVLCSIIFSLNSALSGIMWRNIVQSNRPHITLLNAASALYAG
jgi:hypothetical protein